jgi:1-acyl-sn-glycerol-3-phosphate acyltransferase
MLSEWGAGAADEIGRKLEVGLEEFADADLERMTERVRTTGGDWGLHPPDPVARRISRITHSIVLEPDSALLDLGEIDVALRRPTFLLGNHVSFDDANSLDYLLDRAGRDEIARALNVVVGPKVYSLPLRRLASLCFGAIKIPQSTTRASGEAVMPMREVARRSARALEEVRELQARGEHVLIFVEGSRSRSGSMQPALTAVARYLEAPDVVLVPFGLWGTEKLLPLGDDRMHPATVCARFGPAVDAASLRERCGRRAVVADAVGYLIADLLPPSYRGVYADVGERQRRAREAASAVSG